MPRRSAIEEPPGNGAAVIRRTVHREAFAVSAQERLRRPADLARARPRALTRPHRVYNKGRLRIDFDAYEVFVDGQKVHLFLRELELLSFFVSSPNRVFSREQILGLVWGRDAGIDPRTVDVHVRRLRTRIERDDAHPELIVTVRGVGYKFDERALAPSAADPANASPRLR
jgi:DNA-binding response OmpR family regulator